MMSEQMVEVGGHRLHACVCGSGAPTVLIEGASGSLFVEWSGVQRALARMATVVCYDRAGYGESEAGPEPRTSGQIVFELRAMLSAMGLPGPYVLVGHSLGGLYVNHFARAYPGEVAGVVLIDPVSLEDARFAAEIPKYGRMVSVPGKIGQNKLNRLLVRTGFFKLAKPYARKLVRSLYGGLAPEEQERVLASLLRGSHWDAVVRELVDTYPSFRQVQEAGEFPDIPLIVLYHTPQKAIEVSMKYGIPEEAARRIEALWEELIRDFLTLSSRGEWRVAANSGHLLHIEEPESVCRAVSDLLRRADGGGGVSQDDRALQGS